ncbi:MAG: bifunctional acetate--CoA ligase family protein/GNAT family N-acetyltransferase [Anaerolineae bacterium]|nr:bifunctional acetate--CoA ligase family protein/GNAT family N-acetyltransferase [Candidatus Roseilinea sp.]MDW8450886.1 bifunctional acetate--CoA ligase family protein/GNAT family N-acetyltransferase [Anaerolineae bacterium]
MTAVQNAPMAQTPTGKVITSIEALQRERESFDALFKPKTIAVIGATDKAGSVGLAIMRNLKAFRGRVFPVNPKRDEVLGLPAYPNIATVPKKVDLAVIVTPAPTVPGIIGECVAAGVKAALIISAGFKEIGPQGAELERQILAQAREAHMRIVGPNCLGIMNTSIGLNATFADAIANPGNVAFISQSGALCTAVLDWSFREKVGFSYFISVGSMLDVGWGDLIDYLGDDPNTDSIVMYMETIGDDARAFISAAREVALNKPIIIIKAGRTAAAAQAAASHTGSMAGSDDALDAAFRRCGVLRVNTIADLFYMAEVLAKQPRPKGPRLTVVTNAGGPGVLTTDALVQNGGELAPLSPETMEKLNAFLPPAWSHNNPIDVLGDATPERYAKTLEIAAADPNSDGLLVILTPQAMTDATATAELLRPYARLRGKPVLASWMGGDSVEPGERILNEAGIPTFGYPDTAARMFTYMWRYSDNLRALYETPVPGDDRAMHRDEAAAIVAQVRASGRTLLTEYESKRLLASYGIPTVPTYIAETEDQAVEQAEHIGYPVVLKLHSETVTHKTDVGGVHLNLCSASDVRDAYRLIKAAVSARAKAADFLGVTVQPMVKLDGYELILGSTTDAQLGPVLLFGTGGQLVEVFKDRALGLPPLNTTLARRMMEQTKIYTALKGVRGRRPVPLDELEQLMVRFSYLVAEQRWIKEIDINPLLASEDRLIALDARVVLHDPKLTEAALPRTAIKPYPVQYVGPWTLNDGTPVTIRPIRPEDEPLLVEFHRTLSEQTVYQRYFHPIPLSERIAHERLTRIAFVSYEREMALVAEMRDAVLKPHIIGVGRLIKLRGGKEAEFAILISDEYQHQGLGRELLRRLVEIGRQEGVKRIVADILPDNVGMIRVSEQVGFTCKYQPDEGIMKAELVLA